MGTSKFNAGGNPAMDQHPIYEGVTLSLKTWEWTILTEIDVVLRLFYSLCCQFNELFQQINSFIELLSKYNLRFDPQLHLK